MMLNEITLSNNLPVQRFGFCRHYWSNETTIRMVPLTTSRRLFKFSKKESLMDFCARLQLEIQQNENLDFRFTTKSKLVGVPVTGKNTYKLNGVSVTFGKCVAVGISEGYYLGSSGVVFEIIRT